MKTEIEIKKDLYHLLNDLEKNTERYNNRY
jgi:hypothetical protein